MESIFMIIALFAVMYFMMIRPEKKRKQQAQQMRDGLKKGDIVTTIGGVIGKVVFVSKDSFVLETSEDRVRMEFTKWALSSIGVQTSDDPAVAEKEKKEKNKAEKAEESTVPAAELPTETEEK